MRCAYQQTIQRYWTPALLLAGLLSASIVQAHDDHAAQSASPCRPETHNVYTQPRGGHPGKSLRLVRVSKVTRDACSSDARDLKREAAVGARKAD
jgi:hypothetical protein